MGRATSAHACWGWMAGAQKAEAVGARRSPIAVVEAEAVAGSEAVLDVFSGRSARYWATRRALMRKWKLSSGPLTLFLFLTSDFGT